MIFKAEHHALAGAMLDLALVDHAHALGTAPAAARPTRAAKRKPDGSPLGPQAPGIPTLRSVLRVASSTKESPYDIANAAIHRAAQRSKPFE
jgi:hypothetical protein